jgi:hypothetical protein
MHTVTAFSVICKYLCNSCSRCIKARITQELEGTLWCEKAYRMEVEPLLVFLILLDSPVMCFQQKWAGQAKPFFKSPQIANPQMGSLRYHKSANFLGVAVRESQIFMVNPKIADLRILWLIPLS